MCPGIRTPAGALQPAHLGFAALLADAQVGQRAQPGYARRPVPPLRIGWSQAIRERTQADCVARYAGVQQRDRAPAGRLYAHQACAQPAAACMCNLIKCASLPSASSSALNLCLQTCWASAPHMHRALMFGLVVRCRSAGSPAARTAPPSCSASSPRTSRRTMRCAAGRPRQVF